MFDVQVGDCLSTLRAMRPDSVSCCVTSPPYYFLRNYLHPAQIGRENTVEAYISRLVDVFREVRRVLRRDGSLWLNCGDSYARGPMAGGIKKKDLVGAPWLLALALRQDGWYLRGSHIWHKPNGTPESVADRPSRCHEYVFLLTKTAHYYYDKVAVLEANVGQRPKGKRGAALALAQAQHKTSANSPDGKWAALPEAHGGFVAWNPRGRNRRSVWTIPTGSLNTKRVGIEDVDHFAVFPPALVRPCVLASTSQAGCCPSCGTGWKRIVVQSDDAADDTWAQNCDCPEAAPVPAVVLDPFSGSATTGVVCIEEGRDFIGLELNADYARLGRARLDDAQARMTAKAGGGA